MADFKFQRIGQMLGWGDNPIYKSFDANRSALMQGFAGLGMDPMNPAAGFAQGFARGTEIDRDLAKEQQEQARQDEMRQRYAQTLSGWGGEYGDLAEAVLAGGIEPADAYMTAWQRRYAPQSAPDPTTAIQEYQYAQGQGYGGTFEQWKTDVAKAGATNIDFNQSQGVAAGYADRMAAANAILEDPKLTQAQTDVGQQWLGGIPVVGNFLTSEEKKKADQAQRDFVNAILRRESGAVISESEFASAAQQYFPQPGDTPAVIEQKRKNREMAIQGVARSAGPNYQSPTLTPAGVVPYTEFFR